MNKKEITDAGFSAVRRSPHRLIASIQGPPKSGKSRLALTAKKPCGYISIEIGGDEGVVDQFIPHGANSFEQIQIAQIRMAEVAYPVDISDPKKYDEAVSQAVQDAANIAMDRFYAAYYASLANFETTIVDTGSDLWEIMRLANFGRLEKVPQLAYTQVNKMFDRLIDDAFSSKGSTILVHHLKEKWESFIDEKTGKERGRPSGIFEMAGYGGIKKKVQAVVELWREDLSEPDDVTGQLVKFFAQIIDSRHFAGAMGKQFEYDFTFTDIGTTVMPGSTKTDWE